MDECAEELERAGGVECVYVSSVESCARGDGDLSADVLEVEDVHGRG